MRPQQSCASAASLDSMGVPKIGPSVCSASSSESCELEPLAFESSETESMEVDAVDNAASSGDKYDLQAAGAADSILPPARGALKAALMKRPSKVQAPVCENALLGQVKLQLNTKSSYILQYNPKSQKWPLVVTSSDCMHQEIMQAILSKLARGPMSKADCVRMRDEMQESGADTYDGHDCALDFAACGSEGGDRDSAGEAEADPGESDAAWWDEL